MLVRIDKSSNQWTRKSPPEDVEISTLQDLAHLIRKHNRPLILDLNEDNVTLNITIYDDYIE
jgi:hypothetical protein